MLVGIRASRVLEATRQYAEKHGWWDNTGTYMLVDSQRCVESICSIVNLTWGEIYAQYEQNTKFYSLSLNDRLPCLFVRM